MVRFVRTAFLRRELKPKCSQIRHRGRKSPSPCNKDCTVRVYIPYQRVSHGSTATDKSSAFSSPVQKLSSRGCTLYPFLISLFATYCEAFESSRVIYAISQGQSLIEDALLKRLQTLSAIWYLLSTIMTRWRSLSMPILHTSHTSQFGYWLQPQTQRPSWPSLTVICDSSLRFCLGR